MIKVRVGGSLRFVPITVGVGTDGIWAFGTSLPSGIGAAIVRLKLGAVFCVKMVGVVLEIPTALVIEESDDW